MVHVQAPPPDTCFWGESRLGVGNGMAANFKLIVCNFEYVSCIMEKEMAIYSSVLAWGIPWIEKPGKLQSMGSQRVGRD